MNKEGVVRLTAVLVVLVLGMSTIGLGLQFTSQDAAGAATKQVVKAPVVFRQISSTSTSLGASSIVLGQSVTDNATVKALWLTSVPTGTVSFQVNGPNAGWTTYADGVALVSGKAISPSYTPTVAGNYYFRAVYNGDPNFLGSKSGVYEEPLKVTKASSSTTTDLGTLMINLGQSVKDNASVTGITGNFPNPTGTVNFQVSFNGGNWKTFAASVPLINGKAISAFYKPSAAGIYDFRAVYTGDRNYLKSQSSNDSEPLGVGLPGSHTTTSLGVTAITLGGSVRDNATVTADSGMKVPTGTVQFQVSFNGSSYVTYDTKSLVNAKAKSIVYKPMAAGNYQFRAVYSGDKNTAGSQSVGGSEPLRVNAAASVTTTSLGKATITLGQSVKDNATVTGLTGFPVPNGTVQFQVKFGTGAWVAYDNETLSPSNGKGAAVSVFYKPLNAGSYQFRAVYAGDPNYLGGQSRDGDEPLAVGQAGTTTVTVLSSDTIHLGQSVLDTATVTGLGSPFPVPTGNVDFQVKIGNGAWISFDNETLSAGSATSKAYVPTVVGNYNFRAMYAGDSNYLGSASNDISEPLGVGHAPSTTVTDLGVSSIVLGQSVTDNVTVSKVSGALPVPTGSVQFLVSFNGSAYVAYDNQTLANGQAVSIPFKPLAAGNYQFRAVYAGDDVYAGSMTVNGTEPLTVAKAGTTTTTALDFGSILFGSSVFDTATVNGLSSPFPVPTGNVDFQVSRNGGSFVSFDNKTLIGGSVTSIAYSPTAPGNYNFRAVYGGDNNYLGSTSDDLSEPLVVGKAPSAVFTQLVPADIVLGQSVTDIVNVINLAPGPIPEGTVQFLVSFNGSAYVAYDNQTLVSGAATSSAYQPLAAGNYQFRAVYSGDSNYNGNQSLDGSEPLTVGQVSTTTDTRLDFSSILLGSSVFDTATVNGLGSPFPVPTGNVDFQVSFNSGPWISFDNGETLIGGSVTSNAYIPSVPGNYNFRAVYGGDNNYLGSTSDNASEPLGVGLAPSETMTFLSSNEITLGGSVTDFVSVNNLASLSVPTGTVQFQVSFNGSAYVAYDNQTLFGGIATSAAYQPLAAGSYQFQAVYSGDANFNGSTSLNGSEPLSVVQATTITTTLLDSTNILLGVSVFDTATVAGLGSPFPVPTGNVDFQVSFNSGPWISFDNGTLSTGSVTSSAYIPKVIGNYNFRAVYGGDNNYLGSTSDNASEPLGVTLAPSFTVTSVGVDSITLGQSVTDNVTVINLASVPVPTGTVQFQVSFNGSAFVAYDNQTLANGVATSKAYQPLAAGNYFFRAVYSGDAVFDGSMSVNDSEPLGVIPASTVTATSLDTPSILFGESVFDTAIVTGLGGSFPVPTGNVSFEVRFGNGAWVQYDNKTLVAGTATAEFVPSAVGSYTFRAIYFGDLNYNGSRSADGAEPLSVGQAPTFVLTDLGTSEIVLGQSVRDNVTVGNLASGPVPTGTVQFQVSFNGSAYVAYDNQTLVGGTAISVSYQPAVAGNYLFQAVYSGDANFTGSVSLNFEPLAVGQASTITTTSLDSSRIQLGVLVFDTATVAGPTGFLAPTGNVDFQVSFNHGAWVSFDNETLVAGTVTSVPYTPSVFGDYNFRAVYGGDNNYLGSMSDNGSEPLIVDKAPSDTMTSLSSNQITLGESVTDSVTVINLASIQTPTGTVQFQVSFNGAAYVAYDNKTLANGMATSASYMPLRAGSFEFRAVYSGDDNFNASVSLDGSEPLSVGQAQTTTTNVLSSSVIHLGTAVSDTATVTGLGNPFPIPTGNVTFQVRFNNGDWVTFDNKTLVDGSATSKGYTPTVAGSYDFRAIYNGDDNYLAVPFSTVIVLP
jgi:large repetitive protein